MFIWVRSVYLGEELEVHLPESGEGTHLWDGAGEGSGQCMFLRSMGTGG